jgi:(S)-2-hydroxyglutarate dehydrogenase
MTPITTLDAVVVGGGLVGLATAYRLLEADPALAVAVVEKEPRVAEHQSGRSSNVLHSGIYYRPGSLRAELCTRGKRELEAYAERRGIEVRRLGKLVVAVDEAELPRLDDLLERGRANGVGGLELIGPAELREREPNVAGLRALLVPGTAVADFRRVAETLAQDVRDRGGRVLLGEAVRSFARAGRRQLVATDARELTARVVVACAGLQSDRLGGAAGRDGHRIVPFRGTYRPMVNGGEGLVRGLVYPVPDPTLPFLGVHFTPQVDGSVWIGPNALLSLSREGRARSALSVPDVLDWLSFPGTWRLAARHLGSGAAELRREVSDRAFLRACRRYVPGLRASHLGQAFSGVRAQLLSRTGELVDDFVVSERPGRVQVVNAPSPAGTACLAIGEVVAGRVRAQLAA